MQELVLIDGNAITHAQMHAPKLISAGQQTQAIFGTIRACAATYREYPNAKILFLWDGVPEYRKSLYPDYKGNRAAQTPAEEAEKEEYKRQAKLVREGLYYLGVPQVQPADMEADDIAGITVVKKRATHKIRLVTGDKDWLQLVDKNVTWYDPIRELTVTEANFEEVSGFKNPIDFVQAKALMGDKSDNITGVGGIGEVGAKALLEQYGSVQGFFEAFDRGEVKKGKKLIEFGDNTNGGRDRFALNMKLVDLTLAPETPNIKVYNAQPDFQKFYDFCARLSFASILSKYEEFVKPFQK